MHRVTCVLAACALACAPGAKTVRAPEEPPRQAATSPAVQPEAPAPVEAPPRKEFDEPASRLDEAVRGLLKQGFVHKKGPVVARMETFQGLDVPVDGEHCYAFFVRLAKGAAFSDVARRGLSASLTLPDGTKLPEDKFSLAVSGPGGVAREACPRSAGKAHFDLAPAMAARAGQLGIGNVTIEVFARATGSGRRPTTRR
jgi:hypothetical protein